MKARCDFCFRSCVIEEGNYGWCRVRKNENGKIISPYYGIIPAIAVDPVEKKPLYHFLPGTSTLSFGASGCNLSCDFCQNWELSQEVRKGSRINPDEAIQYALENDIPSISFTYSEPLVWQDYMLSLAAKAKDAGLRTIMVSNGSFSSDSLKRIIPYIDAYNIDVKGDGDFYKTICHGLLDPVLDAVGEIARQGKHIEITTMVIEGIHTPEMIREIEKEIYERGVQVWHLSRFFPQYKMNNRKPTSELYLARIIEVARESKIPYIYPGNSYLKAENSCPCCGKVLGIPPRSGECPHCGERIYGVWF